jgi:rhodanese-related sulfurtransferase/CBS domain-containing protein
MPTRIEIDRLQRLLADGAQLVEVLPADRYAKQHLPGAINIPLKELDASTTAVLDKRNPVVVYCADYLWDLSPRAACRLETLGFEQVYDYVPGKVDWLARGLPTEGELADRPTVGRFARNDVVTCELDEPVGSVRRRVDESPYGFALVVSSDGTLLGRLRRSALDGDPDASAESVMEPGPTTVRPDTPADELAERIRERDLKTAVISTPEGRLIGIVRRRELEDAAGLGAWPERW